MHPRRCGLLLWIFLVLEQIQLDSNISCERVFWVYLLFLSRPSTQMYLNSMALENKRRKTERKTEVNREENEFSNVVMGNHDQMPYKRTQYTRHCNEWRDLSLRYITAEYPAVFVATIEQCINQCRLWALTNAARLQLLMMHKKMHIRENVIGHWLTHRSIAVVNIARYSAAMNMSAIHETGTQNRNINQQSRKQKLIYNVME